MIILRYNVSGIEYENFIDTELLFIKYFCVRVRFKSYQILKFNHSVRKVKKNVPHKADMFIVFRKMEGDQISLSYSQIGIIFMSAVRSWLQLDETLYEFKRNYNEIEAENVKF